MHIHACTHVKWKMCRVKPMLHVCSVKFKLSCTVCNYLVPIIPNVFYYIMLVCHLFYCMPWFLSDKGWQLTHVQHTRRLTKSDTHACSTQSMCVCSSQNMARMQHTKSESCVAHSISHMSFDWGTDMFGALKCQLRCELYLNRALLNNLSLAIMHTIEENS